MRAPEQPRGCPRAMAPPLTLRISSSRLELADAGERLRRERLVDLDEADVGEAEAGPLERLARGGDRPDAHDARVDAGDRLAADGRQRRDAALLRRLGRHEHEAGGAVVAAGRVAGRDGAALLEHGARGRPAARGSCGADTRRCRRPSAAPCAAGTSTEATRTAFAILVSASFRPWKDWERI